MVKDDILIDTEISKEIDNIDDITSIEPEREIILENSRSVNVNNRVCHSISKNNFNMFDFSISHTSIQTLNVNLIDLKADTTIGAQFAINYVNNVDNAETYTISFKAKKINYGQDVSSGTIVVYMYGSNNGINYELISSAKVVFVPTLNQEYSISKELTGYSDYRFYFYNSTGSTVPLDCETQYYDIQFEKGSIVTSYEPYEGCLYGLELYDMIETNFITNNYYVNCGIIALFLALIVILVNAPFLFIRKIKGD